MTQYEKQAKDFLDKHGLTIEWLYLGRDLYFDGDTEPRDTYTYVIRRNDAKRFSGKYGDSIINSDKARETGIRRHPSAYDLLSSLGMEINTPETFEDFCAELGYDEDSRKAERLYHKLGKFSKRLRAFFTEEERAELQEIQ